MVVGSRRASVISMVLVCAWSQGLPSDECSMIFSIMTLLICVFILSLILLNASKEKSDLNKSYSHKRAVCLNQKQILQIFSVTLAMPYITLHVNCFSKEALWRTHFFFFVLWLSLCGCPRFLWSYIWKLFFLNSSILILEEHHVGETFKIMSEFDI